jgi:hypothetical protein
MTNETDGNGRVTMALLGSKLDNLAGLLERHLQREERCEARITALEIGQGERKMQIAQIQDDIRAAKSRDTAGNFLTGIITFVGAIVVEFVRKP